MATLKGTTISETYPLLLKIASSGVDGTLRNVEDGDGTASALKISSDAIQVDDITLNGSTISDGGDLTFDIGGDIILDADDEHIWLKDGGTTIGNIDLGSQNITIRNSVSNADLIFRGNDGGTEVEAMRINYSGNNVGIGTSSVGAKLHVDDDRSTAYNAAAEIAETVIFRNKNGTDNSGVNNVVSLSLQVADGATSQGFINYVRTGNNTGDFTFSQRTGSSSYSEHMRINSSGNVGIGTTSPASMLHLSTNNGPELTLSDANAGTNVKNYGIYSDSGLLGFRRKDDSHSGYSPTMVIKESSVGIGTTSPSDVFHAHGQTFRFSSDSYNILRLQADANDDGSNDDILIQFVTGSGGTVKGEIRYDESSNRLEIGGGEATNQLYLNCADSAVGTSGDFQPGADIQLQNGRGISFSNMPNESGMTSELLDDYEEGTYTINITGTTADGWTNRSGYAAAQYVKIGSLVTVSARYETSSADAGRTGTMRFNLPFTVADLTDQAGGAAGSVTVNRSGFALTRQLTAVTFDNVTYFNVQIANESGGTETYIDAPDIDGTFEGHFSITYRAA